MFGYGGVDIFQRSATSPNFDPEHNSNTIYCLPQPIIEGLNLTVVNLAGACVALE